MITFGVFVPALMAVGILVSGAIVVADWVSGLLPSRAIRRRQQMTHDAMGVVTRIAAAAGVDIAPLAIANRTRRPRIAYSSAAVVFAVLGVLAARFGEDLYSEPIGWLTGNPWTLALGYGVGGALLVLAAVSAIPALVSLQSGRVVRSLVEHTWLGKPISPPQDPRELVGRERNSP